MYDVARGVKFDVKGDVSFDAAAPRFRFAFQTMAYMFATLATFAWLVAFGVACVVWLSGVDSGVHVVSPA